MGIVYQEPVRAFRFLVKVDGSEEISAAFSRFSGIRMQVETIRSRGGDDLRGVQEIVPVLTSYEPVTLSRGVVGDNDFLEWMLSACADMETGPTGENLYRTIEVVSLNERGQPGVTWILKNAIPIGYELSPMDSSRSEVLTETVTFAISGMQRTTMPEQE